MNAKCVGTSVRGFTLIELMVVISIIALLISILLPALAKAKEFAKMNVCAANIRSIGLATTMYANDSDGYLPPFGNRDIEPNPIKQYYWTNFHAFTQYLTGEEIGFCGPGMKESNLACPSWDKGSMYPPPNDGASRGNNTYGANWPNVFKYLGAGSSVRLDDVPNNQFLFADALGPAIYDPGPVSGMVWDYDGDGIPDTSPGLPDPGYIYNLVWPWHVNRTANFVFADGSVKSLTYLEWITNESNIWNMY